MLTGQPGPYAETAAMPAAPRAGAAVYARVNPTLGSFYPHARVRSYGFMRYLRNLATFLLPAALPLGFSWRHPHQRAEDGGEMALMWEDYFQMRQALSRLMRAAGARSW